MLLDRGRGDDERLGDPFVRFPLGHRREHVLLSGAEPIERPILPTAPQHPSDDLRIQRAAAVGDPPDRIDERLHISDALLQEVPDALGVLTDQLEGVMLLVELRQDEDAGLGALPAKLERRSEPVVLETRRHLHIDHRHIRAMGERSAQKVLGIAGLGRHLEACLGKQASDPLAQKHVVLADHHAQRLCHPSTVSRPVRRLYCGSEK